MREVSLSKVLSGLREDLLVAQKEADPDLKFEISDIEVELLFTITKGEGDKVAFKCPIFSWEDEQNLSLQRGQRVRFKLKPLDADGKPIEVSDRTARPK